MTLQHTIEHTNIVQHPFKFKIYCPINHTMLWLVLRGKRIEASTKIWNSLETLFPIWVVAVLDCFAGSENVGP